MLLLLTSSEAIAINNKIQTSVKAQHMLKALSILGLSNKLLNGNNNKHGQSLTPLMELINSPDYENMVDRSLEQLKPHHFNSFIELYDQHTSSKNDKEESKNTAGGDIGTFEIHLLKAAITRDMDKIAGKSDVMLDAKVGHGKLAKKAMTNVHDNRDNIEFATEPDNTLVFRNVRKTTKHGKINTFSVEARDDDVLGYDRIGSTDNLNVETSIEEKTVDLMYKLKHGKCKTKVEGKPNNVCSAGKVTLTTKFIPGETAELGTKEDPKTKAPWRLFSGYPNYENEEKFQQVGTKTERNNARVYGFVTGVVAGITLGFLDILNQKGMGWKNMIQDAKDALEPLGQAWDAMSDNLKDFGQKRSWKTAKAMLKSFLMIAKECLMYFVNLAKKSKAWAFVFTMIVVLVTFVLVLPFFPPVAMLLLNVIFTTTYLIMQFKSIHENMFKCKPGCVLKNVHKAWGAIGRIIGAVASELVLQKSFQKLFKEIKNILKRKSLYPKNVPGNVVETVEEYTKKSQHADDAMKKLDDMPCQPCRRRRLQSEVELEAEMKGVTCCTIKGKSSTLHNKNTQPYDGQKYYNPDPKYKPAKSRWSQHSPSENKLWHGMDDFHTFPDDAAQMRNPDLLNHEFPGKHPKWDALVLQFKEYRKQYYEYQRMKNWGAVEPKKPRILDWDGATEALKARARQGVEPPLSAIVPSARPSRWKMADNMFMNPKGYHGQLNSHGNPLQVGEVLK